MFIFKWNGVVYMIISMIFLTLFGFMVLIGSISVFGILVLFTIKHRDKISVWMILVLIITFGVSFAASYACLILSGMEWMF